MKTDVITVSSRGDRIETALLQAEKVAQYKELPEKKALQLRLLTEEMMAMMRSITGETQGKFWIEDEDEHFELHLLVQTRMNSVKREQLLSVTTSGRNASAQGLMGRLRDLFERNADEDVAAITGMYHADAIDYASSPTRDWEWSMIAYQEEVQALMQRSDPAARERWDELEKSVVSHVADEVKVFIRNQQAEMVIYKNLQ